jgi:hypothetical protein
MTNARKPGLFPQWKKQSCEGSRPHPKPQAFHGYWRSFR